MTNCTGIPAEQCVEPYLDGTLSEVEAERFEEHYFDCQVCLAELQTMQAVRKKLGSEPRTAVKAPIPWPIRLSALAAIAAMLVVALMVFHGKRQEQQQGAAAGAATQPAQPMPKAPSPASAAVSQLADLALPAFQASHLRGESGDPHFSAGMKAYGRQDCAAAEKALAQVPAEDQESLTARFYGGACRMHEGDLAGATQSLSAVAAAGDSPQQEAALYYLAQIALAGGDVMAARRYLAHTFQLHGDFEARARAELVKIRGAEGRQ